MAWTEWMNRMDSGVVSRPFGQTRTPLAELQGVTQPDSAAEGLLRLGVQEPRDRVNEFLSRVPSLLQWLEEEGRIYPWRQTTDPWRVYVSEILLQRTRGDLVEEIYYDFFEMFPDAEALHSATDQEIRGLISSLGFGNQRTRTLHEVADLVHVEHSGVVPESEEELLKPWRVGPYSARATLLFAFDLPFSLVDSNIARVIARVFGFELPSQPHKSESMYTVMDGLLPQKPALARSFTLALLDLGALVCKPDAPECSSCPLSSSCCFVASSGT